MPAFFARVSTGYNMTAGMRILCSAAQVQNMAGAASPVLLMLDCL
jgi:hypothetical protein